jgi:acyl-CoA synthetase (AMP-forming)/AMP-acid ligase II
MSAQIRLGVRARLTGPGGPFEIAEEDVLGERMPVFKNRARSLRELLLASALHGEREYLVHGERRVSYGQHLAQVAAAAAGLRERYGIEKDDRVAILAANCAEWPVAFWATVSLGGIVAALNGWWTADEIAYGVADSAPKLLIGDRARLARAQGLGLTVPTIEIESGFGDLLASGAAAGLPDVPLAEDDPAVILYTSGTTGRPKGALASHRGIVGFAQTTAYAGAETALTEQIAAGRAPGAPAPTKQSITLATSPMFHLSGLYATIVLQLALGGQLVIRSGRFDEAEVIRLMARERVTAFAALGSMGPRIARHPELAKHDLSCVENVGFGGAPVSPAVQELLRAAFPNARDSQGIGYGSSESVSAPTSIRGAEYRQHPTSAGRVIPTHACEIRDDEGKPLPDGAEGEIHIRSPYVMLGYWGNPEATAATLKPGRWLATGDIGRLEGGLLYVNSRARDLILRNAENVYPVEIEYRLEQHPGVREATVFGIDHEEWGQEVKAVVVPEAGAPVSARELASWCAETLAAYKVPTAWEVRPDPLPRNASGKVLKDVLRGLARSGLVYESGERDGD